MWTITFGVPKLDVRLSWVEVHSVAAVCFLLGLGGFDVGVRVGKAVVQARKCKGTERELAKEAYLLRLVLGHRAVLRTVVPDQMVSC